MIALDSGRVVEEHRVGSPYDEDWKSLRTSILGKALLDGEQSYLTVAGVTLFENGELTETGRLLRQMLSKEGASHS